MRLRKPLSIAIAFVLAPAAVVGAASCTNGGNSGQSVPDASIVLEVPWFNGLLPAVDNSGNVILPATPAFPPIAYGMQDPGSTTGSGSCAALAGLEFSQAYFDTFEPLPPPKGLPNPPQQVGVGQAWTSFDDLTKYSFHVPGDVAAYPALVGGGPIPPMTTATYGLPAVEDAPPSCDGKPNHWSLHFRGGEFRNWGGGVSRVFTDLGQAPQDTQGVSTLCDEDAASEICPPPLDPDAAVDTAGLPTRTADGGLYAEAHNFLDVSAYEGLAFWARTGPEGQSPLLVTITDNFTSDRLARQNQKFCRRLKQCWSHCLNGMACSPDVPDSSTPVYRCFDSNAGGVPSVSNDALLDLLYPRCGPSACTFRDSYPDFDFEGKTCQPYTFPAADISAEYCYDNEDPPPPDRDEQCLDGWAHSVPIGTDWQFYTIPFSDMQQGGYGKKAPYFNLKAVDTIAFSAIVGWSDVFVDNVTFYRHTK
jgi:hypothetical protein